MNTEPPSKSGSSITIALIGAAAILMAAVIALLAPYVSEWSKAQFAATPTRVDEETDVVVFQDPLGAFVLEYPGWCPGFSRSMSGDYGYVFGNVSFMDGREDVTFRVDETTIQDVSQICGMSLSFHKNSREALSDDEWNSLVNRLMLELESTVGKQNSEASELSTDLITSQGDPNQRSVFVEMRMIDQSSPPFAFRLFLVIEQRAHIYMLAMAGVAESENATRVDDMRRAIKSITWNSDNVIKAIDLQ